MIPPKIRNAFFELLRCVMCDAVPEASVFAPLDKKEWRALLQLVRLQRVTGICMSVIEQLPKAVQPPIDLYLQWMADRSYILSFGARRIEVAQLFLSRFAEQGIHPLVMKGWAFAQYYRDPMLRMSADVDFYFPERFEEAMTLVRSWGMELVKGGLHQSVDFQGVHIEMHPQLISPASLGKVDETPREVKLADGLSFLSPVDASNAVLMLTHMARHLMIGGADCRHLCDYLLLLKKAGDRLDVDALRDRLTAMGMGRFSDALQQIGKSCFGLEVVFRCYPDSAKQERLTRFLLQDLLSNGMEGQFVKESMARAERVKRLYEHYLAKMKIYVYMLKRLIILRPFWSYYADREIYSLFSGWVKRRFLGNNE